MVAALSALLANPAWANLIANGDFAAGSTGWTAVGTHYGTGSGALAFNGGNLAPDATLWQSFTTVPGQWYEVAFDHRRNGTGNWTSVTPGIYDGNGLGGLELARFRNMTVSGSFTTSVFYFQASSTLSTVAIADTAPYTTGVDSLVDNVTVTAGALPSGRLNIARLGLASMDSVLIWNHNDGTALSTPLDGQNLLDGAIPGMDNVGLLAHNTSASGYWQVDFVAPADIDQLTLNGRTGFGERIGDAIELRDINGTLIGSVTGYRDDATTAFTFNATDYGEGDGLWNNVSSVRVVGQPSGPLNLTEVRAFGTFVIPEPGTASLMALAALVVLGWRRRKV
jgi:hypothetical protein